MRPAINLADLFNCAVWAITGLLLFLGAFALTVSVIGRFTPGGFWKEIVENKNRALAVLLGAMSIGMCIIISAVVH